jgi:cyclic-di-GMP phosphodiesterase TipF (flagellum assembly factor)
MPTQKNPHKKNNIVDFGFITRALPHGGHGGEAGLSSLLTFRNIVIAMGIVTFLVFIGSVVKASVAFVIAALMGLAALVVFEMWSRRRWEAELAQQLSRMGIDYERLVREVARNRNDVAVVRKGLANAGALARSYGKDIGGDAVEQRMIKALADQLSKIGEVENSEEVVPVDVSAFDIGAVEKDNAEGQNVGRRLNDTQVLQIVQAAVKHDRIDLFMQPIVNLPQRKTRFFEMFARIRIKPDVYLPAERYIEVALEQDLMPVIDNLLLLRGLQVIRDTEEENYNRAFFCNITSVTLNDPKFMGDLVEFIAQNRTLAPRMIFELGQSDLATMSPDILPVLAGLASLGCRFSMDQVKVLSFDFSHLEARHIRFVKVDGALLVSELKEIGGLQRMKRMKVELDRRGIDLIVEKIETERQLIELLDAEIDYGQGFLFGKPALYKAS